MKILNKIVDNKAEFQIAKIRTEFVEEDFT